MLQHVTTGIDWFNHENHSFNCSYDWQLDPHTYGYHGWWLGLGAAVRFEWDAANLRKPCFRGSQRCCGSATFQAWCGFGWATAHSALGWHGVSRLPKPVPVALSSTAHGWRKIHNVHCPFSILFLPRSSNVQPGRSEDFGGGMAGPWQGGPCDLSQWQNPVAWSDCDWSDTGEWLRFRPWFSSFPPLGDFLSNHLSLITGEYSIPY